MKKTMRTQLVVSIIALGLIGGTALAQSGETTAPTDQQTTMSQKMMQKGHHGKGMGCQGMMDGKMTGKGKMGMHHGKMMAGKKMHGKCMMGMTGMAPCDMQNCMKMMDSLSAEDQQKFMDQTRELRKEMMSKRFDYHEMMRNPASTDQQKEALEKEMAAIHEKMMAKMKAFTE